MRSSFVVIAAAAVLAAGCGDKAQVAGDQRKVDDKAYEAAATGMAVGDWKSGDQKAWETQLKSRAQNQNEYNRSAPGQQ
jgi:hypothetical protein